MKSIFEAKPEDDSRKFPPQGNLDLRREFPSNKLLYPFL